MVWLLSVRAAARHSIRFGQPVPFAEPHCGSGKPPANFAQGCLQSASTQHPSNPFQARILHRSDTRLGAIADVVPADIAPLGHSLLGAERAPTLRSGARWRRRAPYVASVAPGGRVSPSRYPSTTRRG